MNGKQLTSINKVLTLLLRLEVRHPILVVNLRDKDLDFLPSIHSFLGSLTLGRRQAQYVGVLFMGLGALHHA
jgi:hypothetical protein